MCPDMHTSALSEHTHHTDTKTTKDKPRHCYLTEILTFLFTIVMLNCWKLFFVTIRLNVLCSWIYTENSHKNENAKLPISDFCAQFFYSQSHTWVHFDSLGRENILAGRRGCSCFLECNIFHHSDFLSTISILRIFRLLITCLWLSSWLHVWCRKDPTTQGRPERRISNLRLWSEALSQNEQKSPSNQPTNQPSCLLCSTTSWALAAHSAFDTGDQGWGYSLVSVH